MLSNPSQVIVSNEAHTFLQLHESSVHHRELPEAHAEGASPAAAADRLAEILSRNLESATEQWRRGIIERAVADVRAFAAQRRS